MRSKGLLILTAFVCLVPASPAGAQASAQAPDQSIVPHLIRFTGTLQDLSGKPLSGPVDVTSSLYATQSGGSALWFETQTVEANALGNYTVLLGAMTPTGVPMELFTSGEAHWLGVQVSNLPEQSRVLLVSVPYAMKAGDAETLGGKPASDYVLSSQTSTDSTTSTTTTSLTNLITSDTTKTTTTTSTESPVTNAITASHIPVFTDGSGTLADSIMTQSGAKLGINTATPAFSLDLNGNVFMVGTKTAVPGAGGTMRFRDDTGTQRWLFGMPGTAGSQDFQMYNYTNGHAPLFIQNDAASYSLYLSGNGNVGIGTTSPGQKLSVHGMIESTTGGFKFPDGTTQTTAAAGGTVVSSFNGRTGAVSPAASDYSFGQISGSVGPSQLSGTYTSALSFSNASNDFTGDGSGLTNVDADTLGGSLPSAFQPAGSYATLGSNNFTGTQFISSGSGNAIEATSTVGPNSGATGYFENTNGGTILEATDGSDNILKVDTLGVKIARTTNNISNDPTNGTVLYDLVTVDPSTGNAVLSGPGDPTEGLGAVGIVIGNAGTAAQHAEATVVFSGDVPCNFDNTAVAFDFVQISPTTAGLCHDAGATYPSVGQVLGVVIEPGQSPPFIHYFGPGFVGGTGTIATKANCSSSASPAACGSDGAGSVALAASTTSLVVNSTAVTANSQIMIQEDSSLGSKLSVTCNSVLGRSYMVTARSAGTSFTITSSSAPSTNPACLSYVIVN